MATIDPSSAEIAMESLLNGAEEAMVEARVGEALEAIFTAASIAPHIDGDFDARPIVERIGSLIEKALRILQSHFGNAGWDLAVPRDIIDPPACRCSFCGKLESDVVKMIAGF